MSLAPAERSAPIPRLLTAILRPAGEVPATAVVAAAILIALELVALAVAGLLQPLLGLAFVLAPAFAILCWLSPHLAWLLTVAVVPFSLEIVLPGTSSAVWAPTEPMMLIFLAVWGVRAALHGAHRLPRSPLLAAVGVLGLVAVLSALRSPYAFLAFKAILSAAWFVGFAFLYPLLHGREHLLVRRGLQILAVLGTLFAINGIIFIALHGLARWSGNAMGRPLFANHGIYSTYLSFALGAILGLALGARRAVWRWVGLVAGGLVTLAVVLSLARAGYLGLAVFLITVLWYLLHTGRARVILAVVLVVAAAGYGVARFQAGEFVGLYVASIAEPGEPSNLERIGRWLAAWNMAQDHPLLGVGFGAYEDSYFSYRVLTLETGQNLNRFSVHSEYLKVLSEMGWLGFAALLAFLVLVFRQGDRAIRRATSPGDRWLALGALAGIASYLVHGVFNNYMGIDKLSVPLWFLFSVIAGLAVRARATPTDTSP